MTFNEFAQITGLEKVENDFDLVCRKTTTNNFFDSNGDSWESEIDTTKTVYEVLTSDYIFTFGYIN